MNLQGYDDKFASMEANAKVAQRQERWDRDYLHLAKFWAELKSKDPSTKVGSVLVSEDGRREYLGYNGFPRGVEDTPERYNERETKYKLVVHAEANVILKAGLDARGGTIYGWPLFTCNECAKLVIQSGIKRVVSIIKKDDKAARWQSAYEISEMMYNEANVEWILYAEAWMGDYV